MTERRAEILLAARNGESYLREQLDSILAQRDTRWHLTVSDDDSTDNTPGILAEYAAQHPDRITFLRRSAPSGSARDHFFALLQNCSADYILFCDQDDVWLPDKVGTTLDALISLESQYGRDCPALAFCDLTVADAQLKPTAPSLARLQNLETERFDFRSILFQNAVTGCAAGVNRALAEMALRCSDIKSVIMHDWWLAAVCARFGHIAFIPRPLILYRQHGRNAVGAKDVRSAGYVAARLSRLRELSQSIQSKKRQAGVFLESYRSLLTPEEVSFLETFAKPRSGASFYLRNKAYFRDPPRLWGTLLFG